VFLKFEFAGCRRRVRNTSEKEKGERMCAHSLWICTGKKGKTFSTRLSSS